MPLGRRVILLEYPPELPVELATGGVFRFAPALPADATCVGHWTDHERYLARAAVHSNSHELVRIGQVLPLVLFPPPIRLE